MQSTVIEITNWARPHVGRKIHRVRGRLRIETQLRRQGLISGRGRSMKRLKPFVVTTDGKTFLLQDEWRRCLQDGEVLAVVSAPPAGGGGGSRIFAMLAIVALSIWTGGMAAAALGPSLGTALGTTAAIGSQIVAGAVGIAVNIAGNMLLNAVLPTTKSPAGQNRDSSSPNYSITAQGNTARLMEAVPVLYGRFRVYPDYAAQPYTDYRSNDQYLYQLFLITQGELDIEKIRIGETDVTAFSDVQYQVVQPGGQVTLFPDNVVTSDAVSGSQIDTPADGGDWVGPFVTNPAETETTQIGIDVAWPGGLYRYDKKGKKRTTDSPWTAQAQAIDVDGNVTGDWFDLISEAKWSDSEKPIYDSHNFQVPAGRYQVRLKRNAPTSTDGQIENTMTWQALKAYLPSKANYGDCTMLAMVSKAGAQMNSQTSRKINVIGTRQLPIWDGKAWSAPTATRNPAWAIADAFRNSTYGRGWADSRLNLAGLLTLSHTWDTRGDTYDGVFDTKVTLWDAVTQIARVGRAMPMYFAGVVEVIRDEPRAVPTLLLTPHNIIQGSLKIDYSFPTYDTPDYVVAEYTNPNTWESQTVDCALEGSSKLNPKNVQLTGIIQREQAFREGMYMIACNRDQRKFITVKTEMEGYIPRYGDRIDISHDTPAWGLSGTVVDFDPATGILTTSEPLAWYAGQNHYVALRARDGSAQGPYQVTEGADLNHMVLTGLTTEQLEALWVSDGIHEEPTIYQFGPGSQQSQSCLLLRATPQGDDQVELYMVNYAPSVYLAESNQAVPSPSSPSLLTPASGAPTVGFIGLVENDGSDTVHLSVDPVAGATAYEFQISYDGGVTWQIVGLSPTNSIDAKIPPGNWIVRARAIGSSGNAGAWNQNQVTATGQTWPLGTVGNLTASQNLEQRITLSWETPDPVDVANASAIEIRVGSTTDITQATLVGQFAVGTTTYNDTGLGLGVARYYWVRLTAKDGADGADSGPVKGVTSDSVTQLLADLTGQITKSQLGEELLGDINDTSSTASQALTQAGAAAAAAQKNANDLTTETQNRTTADQQQVAATQKVASDLATTAGTAGSALTAAQAAAASASQNAANLQTQANQLTQQAQGITSLQQTTAGLNTSVQQINTKVGDNSSSITALQQASQSQASDLSSLTARSTVRANLLANPSFNGMTGWTAPSGVGQSSGAFGKAAAYFGDQISGDQLAIVSALISVTPGQQYVASGDMDLSVDSNTTGSSVIYIAWHDADGNWLSNSDWSPARGPGLFDQTGQDRFTYFSTGVAPAGATQAALVAQWNNVAGVSQYGLGRPKLEAGNTPTPFSDDQTVTSSAASITTLQQTTATQASQLVTLNAQVGSNTGNITSLQSATATLTSQYDSLSSTVAGNGSAISSLQTASANQAQSISDLKTTTGQQSSAITGLQQTTANQATSLSNLNASLGTAESNITDLKQASASQAQTLSGLQTSVGGNSSAISQLQTTTAGQASQINALGSKTDTTNANLTSESQTRASADSALSSRASTLEATTANQGSSITSLQQASQSQASNLSALTARSAIRANLLANPSFNDMRSWTAPSGVGQGGGSFGSAATYFGDQISADQLAIVSASVDVTPGEQYVVSGDMDLSVDSNTTGSSVIYIAWLDADGNWLSNSDWSPARGPGLFDRTGQDRFTYFSTGVAPAGATHATLVAQWNNVAGVSQYGLARPKLEVGTTPTPYSDDQTVTSSAANITTLQQTTATQASQLVTLNAQVGSNTGNITSLQSATATLTSQYSALSTAVNGQTASIASLQSASATQASNIQRVSYRSNPGVNMLANPTFGRGAAGWTLGHAIAQQSGNQFPWQPAAVAFVSGYSSSQESISSELIGITAGLSYCGSADTTLFADSGTTVIYIAWYDANKNYLSNSPWPAQSGPAVFDLADQTRFSTYGAGIAPTGAAYGRLVVQFNNLVNASQYGARRPKFEQASAPTAYSDDQSAIQVQATAAALSSTYSIRAQLTQDGQVYAAGMSLGVTSANGTVQSQFLVLANQFAVLSSTAGGKPAAVFVIENGTAILNAAIIGNATITSEKVGDLQSTSTDVNGNPLWELPKGGALVMRGSTSGSYRTERDGAGARLYDGNGTLRMRWGYWS